MANASTSSVVTAPERVKRPARNPCAPSALPCKQLLEFAELTFSALDRHIRPLLVVHGIEGQNHPDAIALDLEVNRRRDVIRFDIRDEVRPLRVGEVPPWDDIAIDCPALRG